MSRYELYIQTPVEAFVYLADLLSEECIPWDCDMNFTDGWSVVKIHCRTSAERCYVDDELSEKAFQLSRGNRR